MEKVFYIFAIIFGPSMVILATYFWVDWFAPKFLMCTYKIAFDAAQAQVFENILTLSKRHYILTGCYQESEEGIGVLLIRIYRWKRKQLFRELSAIEDVEVL